MFWVRVALLASALVTVYCALTSTPPPGRSYLEPDQRTTPYNGWYPAKESVSLPDSILLTIAMKLRDETGLRAHARAVSSPSSPRYREYLSVKQVRDMVRPRDEDVRAVMEWVLQVAGVSPTLTPSGDFLRVRLSVQQAERLLQVKFAAFRHRHSGETLFRATTLYTVPTPVAALVDFVGGVHRFPPRAARPARLSPIVYTPAITSLYPPPTTLRVFPSDESLQALFLPVCSNGNYSTQLPPCSSAIDPAPLEAVAVRVRPSGDRAVADRSPTTAHRIDMDSLDCRPCSQWGEYESSCRGVTPSTSAVFCMTPFISNLPNYVELEVSLSSQFHITDSNSRVLSKFNVYDGSLPVYLGKFMSPSVLRHRYSVPVGLQGTHYVD